MVCVCIVPVRRVINDNKYKPSSYEIALEKLEGDIFAIIMDILVPKDPPTEQQLPSQEQLVKTLLQEKYKLSALTVHPLHCSAHPPVAGQQTVTVLHVAPIPTTTTVVDSNEDLDFINLEDLLEQPGQLKSFEDRQSLLMVDKWLSERHHIPTVNLDQLFSSQYSEVGVVQHVVTNPLKDAPIPKEESLVLSFNNPLFPTATTS